MTINIKLTSPVYETNRFGNFDHKANIEINGDFESFSEGYTFLRAQIDELLQQSNAANTLLLNLDELEREISKKQENLKRLNKKIEEANRQLERLESFLRKLGIDPSGYRLYISEDAILKPIVINASDNDDDDDDE